VLGDQTRAPYGSEADAIADADAHPFAWEVARKRMRERYDYAALERALEQLRFSFPDRSPRTELALAFIDERMPDPIRAPAAARAVRVGAGPLGPGAGTRLREERNRKIRAWAKDGLPYQWIAAEVGLGDRQLREIINARRR
jgi:hypothetical protein